MADDMMLDRDLAERLIDRALDLGAEYAEARMEAVRGIGLMLKNGSPDMAGFTRSRGVSVRVLAKGGMGFASLDGDDAGKAMECAETAVSMALASARILKSPIRLSDEPSHVVEYSVDQKKPVADAGLEDLLAVMKHVDAAMTDAGPVASRFVSASVEERARYFANSDDSRIGSTIPRISMFMLPTIMEGGAASQAMLQKGAATGWEFMDPTALGEEVAREIKVTHENMVKGRRPPTGRVDLLLGPEVAGIASHESCGHPYEADRIMGREAAQAGESFVGQDMLGTRIGSDVVTVVDDPTVEHSYGFYLYDDEGVKARPKYLIKEGIINEFLHNRETAAAMDLGASNAAARANSYAREAIVRMSNTFVQPGDYTLEEMLEDVNLGVYMNSFMEWNIDDRRYNQRYIGREAYLIENGRITVPVKAPVLEITTPAFWQAIDAVGKEVGWAAATCGKGEPAQGVPVFTGGPHIRLRDIALGGAGVGR